MSFNTYYPDVHGPQFQTDKEIGLTHNDLHDQYPDIDITGLNWQAALVIIQSIPQPKIFLPNPHLPPMRFQRIYFHGKNLPPEAPTDNIQTCECSTDRINIWLDNNNLVTENIIA